MECAKCHDHKYDPISQEDYYKTFSFFNQVPEKGIFATIGAHSFADPPSMEITNEDIAGVLNFVNKQDTNLLEVMIMKDSSQMRATQVLASWKLQCTHRYRATKYAFSYFRFRYY